MNINKLKTHWQYILIGLISGIIFSILFLNSNNTKHSHNKSDTKNKIKFWTCSMHPQIKLPKKGVCPICAMDLISVNDGRHNKHGNDFSEKVVLELNETGRKLAEVETTEVKYKQAVKEVRLSGKIHYDESKLSYISAWIGGRIDRLFVDFTGTKVRKGEHLIELYSPALISAQEEYLQAVKNLEQNKESKLNIIGQTAKSTLGSVKEKLRLLGIDDAQIKEIGEKGSAQDHMTIRSSVTGTVIHKNGFEGMYVKPGDKIYTIADLSRVWLFLDVYESDIAWIHYGQKAVIETESYPGEIFSGKIAFIDPFVNEDTQTVKVRINVENKNEKLKPGMFARAVIKAVIGQAGKIYQQDLAGKWICSMHPDIVKEKKSLCDICEMKLIKTSEFGFLAIKDSNKKVLVIPKSAPLITGKRAVVYVEKDSQEAGINLYEGREIILGSRAGNEYIVVSGLKAGEKVVSKGNFKIDSAMQIQGKPGMMNPDNYYTDDNDFNGKKIIDLKNKKCPVMGGKTNGRLSVIHNGYKINICCPGCKNKLKNNFKHYLSKLL